MRSQSRFKSNHHKVYTEEVIKITLSSNDDKRFQTFNRITRYPYGTNTFKVCESEMLSKNKMSVPGEDKDKNTPKNKDKTITKNMIKVEDKDKTIHKTKDKDKIIPKTKTKTKTEDKDENRLIQTFQCAKIERNRKNGNWVKRLIVCVFWNNGHISELCEKWIFKKHECAYAYTRFEELRTYSGEVLFTREHKATTSKNQTNIVIDINELQVFKDFINNR